MRNQRHLIGRAATLVLLGWLSAFGTARAQYAVPIEGSYEGPYDVHNLFQDYLFFGASAEDPSAASGLTTLRYGGEGFLHSDTFNPKFANVTFSNARGDRIHAAETFGGGSFTITGGEGAFAGATGGGRLGVAVDASAKRVRIDVRGSATVIPEPSTMVLLLLAGTPLALRRGRRGYQRSC